MTGAGFLLHGISEEKENRIMEVVLSSVSARTFFWGKLLGLGSAGFLQIFVWLVLGGLPLSLAVAVLEIPLWLVGLAFVYYLLGFFLYGALILGTGSLGTNLKEAQQMSMVWSMTGGIGLAFIMPIADDPQSALAVVMSYVPLLTPTVMVARAALGGAMWYEHVLAVALLLATLYFANKFSSKVFRLGLLSYGKKPKIREIWRWMRQGV
jgi:ABC-2 type transport system permease protein